MSLTETLEKLEHGKYTNTRQIVMGGIPYSARDLLVKAPVMAGLNLYAVGQRGEGKTALCNDLVGYFGGSGADGKACYMMGRPDFEPSELLRQVRLDKLHDVKSDRELIELTANVQKVFFLSDELNRAPSIVQNYFLDFMDGKFVHLGTILPLGRQGYTLGFATGNLGSNYVAISDTDDALLDRMHLIVKLDYPDYNTTEGDDVNIFMGKKNPRTDLPTGEDLTDAIMALNHEFAQQTVHPLLPFLGIYLNKGLDYLQDTPKHSKRALNSNWMTAEGVRDDNDENKVYPLSKRAVFGAMALTTALDTIARTRGQEPKIGELFFDRLRLTVPYSGVISPVFIDQMHSGDHYAAFDALFGPASRVREELFGGDEGKRKIDILEEAVLLSSAGIKEGRLLHEIGSLDSRWGSVRAAMSAYAERQEEQPTQEGMKLKEIIEQAHAEEPKK